MSNAAERSKATGRMMEEYIRRILLYIGEDSSRSGIVETPARVVRSYAELFSGYKVDPKNIFKTFDEVFDEMVLLRNVEFTSFCEHHMLPFHGKAHIAYIPQGGKVIGVSKLARLLDMYARRLQIQERICNQVVEALNEHLQPLGAACMIEAKHLCISCRGIQKQHSEMVTSKMSGVFLNKPSARMEFLSLVKGG